MPNNPYEAVNWNPWHGCHKFSEGCRNCYVYRTDEKHEKDSSIVTKTTSFHLPVKRNRAGEYKIPAGSLVWTCFTSDFLLEDADDWRPEAWAMMRERSDLRFLFITKRIHRFMECLPPDWGGGYQNVSICCTCENQKEADKRLPIFREAPIVQKSIVCEPLLGTIDMAPYLGDWVKQVVVGGESGQEARICQYHWVLDIRRQCMEAGVAFRFKQTGYRFVKDGKLYLVQRRFQHRQATAAGINFTPKRIQR